MMHKLPPNRQGVIEYVRLADIPDKQLGTFLEWLPQTYFTKVSKEEHLVEDCIEYEDYEFWFEHCHEEDAAYFEEQI